jgi:ribosomal-protein-alanine N-acetyltransferase
MKFKFLNTNNDYAREILNWHYEGDYCFYDMDFDKEDLEEFLEKIKNNHWENHYIALSEAEEVIGMFSFKLSEDAINIGLGLKSDFTGRGIGHDFITEGINFGIRKFNFTGKYITLSVATFNKRAIKAYKRIGFKESNRYIQLINQEKYEFIKMVKEVY